MLGCDLHGRNLPSHPQGTRCRHRTPAIAPVNPNLGQSILSGTEVGENQACLMPLQAAIDRLGHHGKRSAAVARDQTIGLQVGRSHDIVAGRICFLADQEVNGIWTDMESLCAQTGAAPTRSTRPASRKTTTRLPPPSSPGDSVIAQRWGALHHRRSRARRIEAIRQPKPTAGNHLEPDSPPTSRLSTEGQGSNTMALGDSGRSLESRSVLRHFLHGAE